MDRLLLAAISRSAAPARRRRTACPPLASLRCRRFVARELSAATRQGVGVIKTFGREKGYGFVAPDGADPRFVHNNNNNNVYFHVTEIAKRHPRQPPPRGLDLVLREGMRVRFRARPRRPGGETMCAYELTLEDGAPLALYPNQNQRRADEDFLRIQMARFGDVIFDIAARAKDQEHLEAEVVAAYDRVRANVEAELGEDGTRSWTTK